MVQEDKRRKSDRTKDADRVEEDVSNSFIKLWRSKKVSQNAAATAKREALKKASIFFYNLQVISSDQSFISTTAKALSWSGSWACFICNLFTYKTDLFIYKT